MSHRPIHWFEGMFLRPQHFQAADRAIAETIARHSRINLRHGWGFSTCDIDHDALGGFRFVVRRLEARFRDGSVVQLPEDAPVPELDLKPLFLGRNTLDIHLAVPKWRSNQANAPTPDDANPTRYRVDTQSINDENTGTNPHAITFRSPGVKFLLGDEEMSGYETLHLARLEKSERAEATPKPASGFIPPLLACEAWPGLQVDILQQLFFRINKKIEVLASQVTSRGISFDSHSPGDAKRMHQLGQLNETYAMLANLAFTPGVHPWDSYVELCRILGKLSIFGKEARPPEIPRYDHDDLGGCCWKVKLYIDGLLNDVEDPAYQERPFVGSGLRMQVTLEPAWLESGWQMYLGVKSNVSTEECVRMLTRPERLGMKIGSSDRVDTIFTKGQEGLKFTPAPRPPRDLPSAPNLTYFEVSRESSTNEWTHVQKAKTLAIRIQEKDIAGGIDGQRELTIRTSGQATVFTFTLYLVPTVR